VILIYTYIHFVWINAQKLTLSIAIFNKKTRKPKIESIDAQIDRH
jgi:hypothetical protein